MFSAIQRCEGGSHLSPTACRWLVVALPLLVLPVVPVLIDAGVWQELFFRSRVLRNAWWVLPLALAIEYPAYRCLTGGRPLSVVLLTVGANLFSFFVGMLPQYPTLWVAPGPLSVATTCTVAISTSAAIEWAFIGVFCRGRGRVRASPPCCWSTSSR